MRELIEEEKRYCDQGNYKHMAQIFTSIAVYQAQQKHGMHCGRPSSHRVGVRADDVINFGNLPYTDFKRTKALCQGGDCCDFDFVRHETDAGDGWERTTSI